MSEGRSSPGGGRSPKRKRRRSSGGGATTPPPAPVLVRVQAARAVAAAAREGRSLTRALPECAAPIVDGRDRSFYRVLVFDTIRYWPRYQFLLSKLLGKPLRQDAHLLEALLSVGLCQLEHLHTPAHAAVSTTVDAVRATLGAGPSGLVNAVLRRYDRERETLDAAVAGEASAHHAMPHWWLERLREDWPDDWSTLTLAARTQAPMWLRLNRQRVDRERWLRDADVAAQVHPTLDTALRLESPRDVQDLPGFGAGEVSVQDAAAQHAAPLLCARPGMRILDACAAPGGKSAHVLEMTPDVELWSLDVSPERLAQVDQTFDRLGLEGRAGSRRVAADAAAPEDWWDGVPFDRILLDAPCSASGVMRRHPDIKLLRRSDDLPALAQIQATLLRSLWPLLAPGGRLLYVTCSVLRRENDDVVGDFSREMSDVALLPVEVYGARKTAFGRQLLSGEDDMDGFYYALLGKR